MFCACTRTFNRCRRTLVAIKVQLKTSLCACTNMATFEAMNFDNLALRSLPIDSEVENFVRQVKGACFSKVTPTPVKNPKLVSCSPSALNLLDVPESAIQHEMLVDYFSGNKLLQGSETAAHCYCGHQFGNFAGQLGDGAAMYLGEIVNKRGERWELQIKGAGLTPYSRTADGRKVLRSSIREFLCSEAMHFLGIPTTRAGTCITSDSTVVRDVFYSGNPIDEKCSIVSRIAPTFLRFGSFEIFKPMDSETFRQGPSVGRTDILKIMLDYTVKTFYPDIWSKHNSDKQKMYLEFYKEIVRRTARLVAEWQCVGWCHGVLNTDNMSIVGVTIDYGPYGFMDRYDPDFICNSSDDGGRYTYVKQPEICKWNCAKLGEAIQDAIPVSDTEPCLELFDEEFKKHYMLKMREKLGLKKELAADEDLINSFLDTLQKTGADFTNSFRCLSRLRLPGMGSFEQSLSDVTEYLLGQCASVEELRQSCKSTMDPRQMQMFLVMMQTNPGLLQALGKGYASLMRELEKMEKSKEFETLTKEEKMKRDREFWVIWLKKYTDRLKQDIDESSDKEAANKDRIKTMNGRNPKYVLRNYIAQNAISCAEKGDFSEVNRVLKLLENPYSDQPELEITSLTIEASNTSIKDEGEESGAAAASLSSNETSSKTTFTGLSYDSKPPECSLGLRVT